MSPKARLMSRPMPRRMCDGRIDLCRRIDHRRRACLGEGWGVMPMEQAITVILSIVGGGALLSFIQYLITRHDEKKGRGKTIMEAIKAIRNDLDALRSEISEDRATDARIRILKFSDEVRHCVRHSKESFDQVNSDIDTYRQYCEKHPEYKNNRAVMAIANIERVYAECLKEHDFLE